MPAPDITSRQKNPALFWIITGNREIRCYYLGMQAAGFVLVGGTSSRMGTDKARLAVDAKTLVEVVAAPIQRVTSKVFLVGPRERYADLGFPCIPDIRPHAGPLGGIETALLSRKAQLNLIAACDTPGVDSSILAQLLEAARSADSPCVVTRDASGRVHPLCGVYRSDCLPAVTRALDAGRWRMMDFVNEVKAEIVDIRGELHNLNTPAQWAVWKKEQLRERAMGNNGV